MQLQYTYSDGLKRNFFVLFLFSGNKVKRSRIDEIQLAQASNWIWVVHPSAMYCTAMDTVKRYECITFENLCLLHVHESDRRQKLWLELTRAPFRFEFRFGLVHSIGTAMCSWEWRRCTKLRSILRRLITFADIYQCFFWMLHWNDRSFFVVASAFWNIMLQQELFILLFWWVDLWHRAIFK